MTRGPYGTTCLGCGVRFTGPKRKRCEVCAARYKQSRQRDQYCEKVGRSVRVHHCGWCGEAGHYESTCLAKHRGERTA